MHNLNVELALLEHTILVHNQPQRNGLLILKYDLVVFYGGFVRSIAMLNGLGEMPFDVDLSGNVGDIVEINNLEIELELGLEEISDF